MRMKNKLLPRAVSFSAAAAMLITSVATDLSPFFATEFLMASAESAESDSELKANCDHSDSDAPTLKVTVEKKTSTSSDSESDSAENYEYKVTVSGNDNGDFVVSGIEEGNTISFTDGKATISVEAKEKNLYESDKQEITFLKSDFNEDEESSKSEEEVSFSYKNYYQDLSNKSGVASLTIDEKANGQVHWGDTVVVTPKFGYQVNGKGNENAVAVVYGKDNIVVETAEIGFSCDSKYFTLSSETAKFGDKMTINVNTDYQIAAEYIKVNDEYIVNDDYTFKVPVSDSEPKISVDSTNVSYAVKLGSSNISWSLGENVYYKKDKEVSFTLSSADGYTEDHAPTITDSNGNNVDVTKSDDGTSYSFTMPEAPVTITDDGPHGPQAIKYADIKSDFGAVSVKKDSVVSIENGKAKFEITPTSSAYTVDTIKVESGTEERIYTADSTDDDTLDYNPNNKTCEFDVKGFHNDITISVTYQIHLTVSAADTTDGKTGNNKIKFGETSETLNKNGVEFSVKENEIGSSTFTVSSDKENGWHIEEISVNYKKLNGENEYSDGVGFIYPTENDSTDIVSVRSATKQIFTLDDVFKAMGVSLPGQNISSENGEAVVDVSDVNVSDINVEVVFAQNTYEITLEECTNGFLSADPLTVVYGSKSTITATPNAGYYVSKIQYDNQTVSDAELPYENFKFAEIEGKVTDSVCFDLEEVKDDYTVKADFKKIEDNNKINVVTDSQSAIVKSEDKNTYIVDGKNPVTVSFSDENIADVSIGENDYKAVDGGKFSDTITTDEFTENVTRTYYIRDNSGVVTKLVVTFLVDATEPKINATSSSEKNFARSTKIVVTASDNDETAEDKTGVSGISCIKYKDTQIGSNTEIKVDGETIGKVTAYEENNGVISATITITEDTNTGITGDFSGELTFTAYDNAGLSNEATVTVKNDVTNPTLENNGSSAVEITPETTSASYNNLINTVISVIAKDEDGKAKSGIDGVQYILTDMNSEPANDAEWKSISAKESNDLLKYAEVEVNDGTYTIGFNKDYSGSVWLRSIDKVGNVSETIRYNVNNCVTNPIMSFSYDNDPADWNNKTEFSAYATEGQSIVITGINDVQFSINDKQSWTSINPKEGSSIIVDNITVAEIKPCDLPLSLQNREGAVGYKITFVEDFSGVLYFRCKNNVVDANLWSKNNNSGVTVKFDNTAPNVTATKQVYLSGEETPISGTEFENDDTTGAKNVITVEAFDTEEENGRTIIPSTIESVEYKLVDDNNKVITDSEDGWVKFTDVKTDIETDIETDIVKYAYTYKQNGNYQIVFPSDTDYKDFSGYVEFRTYDKAGNVSASIIGHVKNITSKPEIAVKSNSEKVWSNSTKLDITANRNNEIEGGELTAIEYSFDGNKDWQTLMLSSEENAEAGYIYYNNAQIAEVTSLSFPSEDDLSTDATATITFTGDYYGNIYFRAVNNVELKSENSETLVKNDVTAPEIKSDAVVVVKESNKENARYLNFGIFGNKTLRLSVTVTDLMNKNAINNANITEAITKASGVASVKLYSGNNEIGKMMSGAEFYYYDFNIGTNYDNIRIVAEDNVGNQVGEKENVSLESILKDTPKSNRIAVEDNKPEITLTDDSKKQIDFQDCFVDGQYWVNKLFTYTVNVNEIGDITTGINYLTVKINDEIETNESFSEQSEQKDDRTHKYEAKPGKNKIEVNAEDNAYNLAETKSNEIYVDIGKPWVTQFHFEPVDGMESSENKEGSETNIKDTVEPNNYGFYFKVDTWVTVSVDDGTNSSGIKNIELYKIAKDSSEREYVPISGAIIHDGNWDSGRTATATFLIEANFKGQIYAVVTDNVENSSETGDNKTNAHPDGTVVESESQHNSESEIEIHRNPTNMKDIDGRDLYANDQTIQFTVSDPISGIKTVEWEVSDPLGGITSGKLEVTSDGSLIGDDGWELIADRDENLVTAVTKSVVVGNDRNDITVKLKLTDRAGNTSDTEQNFSIDKTDPKIDVKWNEKGKTYYNKDRIATVTITERNFGSVEPKITGANVSTSSWTRISHDEKNPDSDQWQAKITFHNDADYTFSIRTVDLAGNSDDWPDDQPAEKFTIDQTKPTIEVKFDNNDVKNTNYYKADRTATITVVEHNFDSKDVKVNINSTGANNVDAAESPEETKWENTGKDTYAAKVTFNKDGKYDFTVNYTDLAENKATEYKSGEFYIDKTAPAFDVADSVKKDTAYNKEIAPEVTFSDYNLYTSNSIEKNVSVTFDRVDVNGKSAKDTISPSADGVYTAAAKSNDYMNSYFLEFNSFSQNEEIDGIYEMNIYVEDMAGNINGDTIIFSVNRYGSTYRVINNEAIELLENYHEDIYSNSEVDVVVQEINVVEITDHKITLFKDSEDITLSEGSDYTTEEKRSAVENADSKDGNALESGWYENDYTISKNNFVKDAYYQIDIASKDKADNDVTSTSTHEDRCAPIEFVIDKTLPEIVISGVNEGDVLKESGITLNITCSDLHLTAVDKLTKNDLVVTVNGKEKAIKDIGKSTNASDDIILKLDVEADGVSDKQEVKVKIRDKADNWSDAENENIGKISFTLSATWFDLLLRNTPLMIILILLIILIIVAVIWLIFMRRRRSLNN